MKLDELKLLCDLLNVHPAASASKHKKDIAVSIIDYLKCPFETGSEVFRMKSLKQKTKPGISCFQPPVFLDSTDVQLNKRRPRQSPGSPRSS